MNLSNQQFQLYKYSPEHPLELQLQGHLDASWPAGLIDRVQADAADIASQTSPEHRGRASEEAAAEVANRVTKIRTI